MSAEPPALSDGPLEHVGPVEQVKQ